MFSEAPFYFIIPGFLTPLRLAGAAGQRWESHLNKGTLIMPYKATGSLFSKVEGANIAPTTLCVGSMLSNHC